MPEACRRIFCKKEFLSSRGIFSLKCTRRSVFVHSICSFNSHSAAAASAFTLLKKEEAPCRTSRYVIQSFPLSQIILKLLQFIGLIIQQKSINDLIQFPGQNLIQFLDGQANPVIRHPALRKVVGSDPFGTVSRSDSRFSFCVVFFLSFLS